VEYKQERAEPFLKETLAHIDALDEDTKTYARNRLKRSILSSSDNIVSPVQYCPKVFILGRKDYDLYHTSGDALELFWGIFNAGSRSLVGKGAMNKRLLVQEPLRASENPRTAIGRGTTERIGLTTSGLCLSDSSTDLSEHVSSPTESDGSLREMRR